MHINLRWPSGGKAFSENDQRRDDEKGKKSRVIELVLTERFAISIARIMINNLARGDSETGLLPRQIVDSNKSTTR